MVCVWLHIDGDVQTGYSVVSRLCGVVLLDFEVAAFEIGVPCSAIFCRRTIHRIIMTKKTNSTGALVEKGL